MKLASFAHRSVAAVAFALLFMLAIPAFAAIEGTVTNGTTGKPAAGTDVTLIDLSQGMKEAAQTKTDAQGHFKFDADNSGGMPHLVRASYQDVNYFAMVPPGTSTAAIQIYDAAKKVDGLAYNVETAYQTDSSSLQCVQFYVVQNNSSPARTQSANGLEIVLPENANIEESDVQAPGGQPIQTAPDPKGKGHYVFDYPLRPGETTFRVMYTLPYSGEMSFNPTLVHPAQQYAVITPQTMKFHAKNAAVFNAQPHQGGVNIQVATNVTPASDLSYHISGNGQMPDTSGGTDQASTGGGADMGGGQPGRPGGGLGAPIQAPDPLTKYRWPILLILGVMFMFGAFYIATHSRPATPKTATASAGASADEEPNVDKPQAMAATADRASLLLDAMKEELFQLELDRQQGRITPEEYIEAKAALDATLQRALRRQPSNASAHSV